MGSSSPGQVLVTSRRRCGKQITRAPDSECEECQRTTSEDFPLWVIGRDYVFAAVVVQDGG
jgi:hypothetical protein